MRIAVLVFGLTTVLWGVASAGAEHQQYRVNGLSQPAEILVDEWGVPHIYAGAHYDAFFVQGFNAARDRLWQIDLWRKRGLGQLSGQLGAAYADQDAAARLFLYRGSMHDEWLAYGSDAKRIAEAFTAGINAFIDLTVQQPALLSPEFTLLGYAPARWDAEDVVRIRSHGLWRNVTSEVQRAQIACKFGLSVDAMRKVLEPAWQTRVPEGLDPCVINERVIERYRLATAANVSFENGRLAFVPYPAQVREGLGSNNWVVAPSRTATGRPLLANDPHRGHALPSLRYAAHLHAPGLNVIGAGEPALPGISIGHNERIAFGLTIFAIDHEDLYVYQTNPNNPNEYRHGDAFEKMTLMDEDMPIKGQRAQRITMKFTRHGPVVYEDTANHRAFAIRAAWLQPGMAPYFGSVEYMRAGNWDQFLGALNRWGAPSENQVYADVDGNIGYRPAGLFPRRTNFDGLLPVPGDGRYEWHDYFDMDALPAEFNPGRGWAATANSMVLPADYPIDERRVGFEWTAPWRYERIAEVLQANSKISVADALALQRDYVSLPARRLLALLEPLRNPSTGAAPALALLRGWNATLGRESAPAALFNVWWQRHLNPAVAQAILPTGAPALISSVDSLVLLDYLESHVQPDARAALLESTLASAYTETQSLLGADASAWRWGELHQIQFEHPLLARLPADQRSAWAVPPYGRGGNGDTPNNTSYAGNDFQVRSGASWRMVLDVGNWDAARMTNAPGQSGDPRSPFYANLLQNWANDDSYPLLYSRKEIEAHLAYRITLVPDDGKQ